MDLVQRPLFNVRVPGFLRTQNGYLLGQGVLNYFKPLALILVRFGGILKQNKCQCVDFS